MNWHKNFVIQTGQVFVVWTDGWRTCAGVLGLSSPLIGQNRYKKALWLADTDNKVDRVNETDPGHLCLIVSQICWLIKCFGWTYFCFPSKHFIWLFLTTMHENLLCNTIYRLKTLRSENEKFESVFCVCFCSLLSSCYLCKAMMNDEPYLEPLIKLNKTSLVSAHVDIFFKSV